MNTATSINAKTSYQRQREAAGSGAPQLAAPTAPAPAAPAKPKTKKRKAAK